MESSLIRSNSGLEVLINTGHKQREEVFVSMFSQTDWHWGTETHRDPVESIFGNVTSLAADLFL